MFVEAPLAGIRDRMLAIKALPYFEGLGDESLLQIAEHARERRFRTGEHLLEEGQPVDKIYIVISGAVTTSRQGKTFLVVHGNGAVGVMSALANDQVGWKAVADQDSLTLEIPVTAFLAALREDFGLLRGALRAISLIALRARGQLPVAPDPDRVVELGTMLDHDLTLAELLIELRGQPMFGVANMDALIEMCRHMTLLRVEAGHRFFSIGDPAATSLRIVYGRVRCTAASGEEVDVGSGQVIGSLAAWSGMPHSYSAVAQTTVQAYQSSTEDFLAILEMHPGLALTLLGGLAGTLIQSGVSPRSPAP